jgi:ComF family protein
LIRSAAYFEDSPLRPAIHALKYQGRKVVAQELAEIMVEACEHFGLAADVIMPVPLHQSRLRKRGFNQSELLARGLSVLKSIPLDTKSLIRSRPTQSQMELSAAERHENVKDAFECCRPVAGLTVLLIDDVCTTGSTLDYCATALKANQAKAVMGLTLARAR